MSLIDPTYFLRDVALPSGKYDAIQEYIDRYEPEIIRKLFGYTISELVLNYDSETSEQRIKDLVEGKEYTPAGSDYPIKYKGLINAEKSSLIAYYIFYCWCAEKEVSITLSGGATSSLENANNIGYTVRAVQAWNKMMEMYGYVNQLESIPSVYNFLKAHEDIYPEVMFTELYFRNFLML